VCVLYIVFGQTDGRECIVLWTMSELLYCIHHLAFLIFFFAQRYDFLHLLFSVYLICIGNCFVVCAKDRGRQPVVGKVGFCSFGCHKCILRKLVHHAEVKYRVKLRIEEVRSEIWETGDKQ
jgi:hypothetical protein